MAAAVAAGALPPICRMLLSPRHTDVAGYGAAAFLEAASASTPANRWAGWCDCQSCSVPRSVCVQRREQLLLFPQLCGRIVVTACTGVPVLLLAGDTNLKLILVSPAVGRTCYIYSMRAAWKCYFGL